MVSSCGRFVIIYNGEVYSHLEIARRLEERGRRVRGTSDTEVIIEACAEWGVDRVLPDLIGMFAFALFDREMREIVLVRDRLGIKPLYWGVFDGVLFFGSELKALHVFGGWRPALDRDALSAFMRHNYTPAPHSIYRGVQKLQPSCLLRLGRDGVPRISRYWDLRTMVEDGLSTPVGGSDENLLAELDALLGDAVKRRMVSDAPLGALLSGGSIPP